MIEKIWVSNHTSFVYLYDASKSAATTRDQVVMSKNHKVEGFGFSEVKNLWHQGGGDGSIYNGRMYQSKEIAFTLQIGYSAGEKRRDLFHHRDQVVSVMRSEPVDFRVQEKQPNGTLFIWKIRGYLEGIEDYEVSEKRPLWNPDPDEVIPPILLRFRFRTDEPFWKLSTNESAWIAPVNWPHPRGIRAQEVSTVPADGKAVPKSLILPAGTAKPNLWTSGNAPSNFALYLQGPFEKVGIYTPGQDTFFNYKLEEGQRRILDFGWQECYDPDTGTPHPEEMLANTMNLKYVPDMYLHLRFFGTLKLPSKAAGDDNWNIYTGARFEVNPATDGFS